VTDTLDAVTLRVDSGAQRSGGGAVIAIPDWARELGAMAASATPGPWRPEREPPPVSSDFFDRHTKDGSTPIESTGTSFALGVAVGVTFLRDDAAFIASARTGVPRLIAALGEALEKLVENDRLRVEQCDAEKAALLAERDATIAELRLALGSAGADMQRAVEMRLAAFDVPREVLDAPITNGERLKILAELDDLRAQLDWRTEEREVLREDARRANLTVVVAQSIASGFCLVRWALTSDRDWLWTALLCALALPYGVRDLVRDIRRRGRSR
jgi:hypothetical protein